MSLDLLEPVGDVVKGGLLGAIIDKNDAHGALVVRLRDCSETLLPCSVPHLEFDTLLLHVDSLDFEVDP